MRKYAVIFIATLIAIQSASVLIMGGPVSAVSAQSMRDGIRSTMIYYALDDCFADIREISNEGVSQGIYDKTKQVNVGYLDEPSGGMSCTDVASSAKRMWYGDSLEAMLKDWGYTLNTGDNEWQIKGDVMPKIMPKVRAKAFGGKDPAALSSAQKYLLYNQALVRGCSLRNPSDTIDKLTASQKANYENQSTKYIKVKVIGSEGPVERFYEYSRPEYGTVGVTSTGTPNITARATCSEAASGVASNISSYNSTLSNEERQRIEDDTNDARDGGAGDEEDESNSNCTVQGGLSWLLCPMMNTMAMMNDWAFSVIQYFLKTPPLITFDSNGNMIPLERNGIYQAWGYMRTLANAMLVVVVLVIIYSQITSMGISNYGIKRLLPKLIVGAILINVSFWIAALAVDMSNVVGSSVYNVITGIGETQVAKITTADPDASGPSGAGTFVAITTLVLGGTAIAVMAGLSVLLPLLVSGVFMFMALVFVLTFRHAMVFILIVAAPLALVAYMLPNTEGIFKTWSKMLRVLLLIYPAVAFIMGISTLAGSITFEAAEMIEDSIPRLIMMMIAVAMPVMGIFAAIMLAKTMGSIMSKLGVSNPLGGLTSAARNRSKDFGERRDKLAASRHMQGGFIRRNTLGRRGGQRGRMTANIKNQSANTQLEIASLKDPKNRKIYVDAEIQKLGLESSRQQIGDDVANRVIENSQSATIAGGIMKGGAARAQAAAQSRIDARSDERINNRVAQMQEAFGPENVIGKAKEAYKDAAISGDIDKARAAARILSTKTGSAGVSKLQESLEELHSEAPKMSAEDRANFTNVDKATKLDLGSLGLKGSNRVLDEYSRTAEGTDIRQTKSSVDVGKLNQVEIAGQSKENLESWITSGQLSKAQAMSVMEAHEKGTLPLDSDKSSILLEHATRPTAQN